MRISTWYISTLGLVAYVPQVVADNPAAIMTIYVERVQSPASTESTTRRTVHHASATQNTPSTIAPPSYSAEPTMPVLQQTGAASAFGHNGVGLVAIAGVLGLVML